VKKKNNAMKLLYFLLFFSLSIASLLRELNPRNDFKSSSFPCETACQTLSSEKCFATNWRTPSLKSQQATEGCSFALYSVSLGFNVDDVNSVDDFWGGKPCSIMFLSRNSSLIQRTGLQTLNKLRNWTLILVDDFPEFTSNRRAGKIPKFSPESFFSTTVKRAIYLDSKFILKTSPVSLIQNYSLHHSNILLTAIAHPRNKNIDMEVKLIDEARKSRPSITSDIQQVIQQYKSYHKTGLLKNMKKKNITQTVIEAGMLIHTLHDPRGVEFRCAWLDQVQRYSDRDQVAFPFVSGWFNSFHSKLEFKGSFLLPLKFSDEQGGMAYLNILSNKYYWSAENSFGAVRYDEWHKKVN
jgi:hypothetical protein